MLIVYWPHNVNDSRITHAYAPKTAVLCRIGQKQKRRKSSDFSAFCEGKLGLLSDLIMGSNPISSSFQMLLPKLSRFFILQKLACLCPVVKCFGKYSLQFVQLPGKCRCDCHL